MRTNRLAHGLHLLVAAIVVLMAGPAAAEPPALQRAWQQVISLQIEAFRQRDAQAAFSFAGEGFHLSFPTAESFFEAVVSSGYAPIMESVSHGFGPFQMRGRAGVVQHVHIVGSDRAVYEAVYQLIEEPDGWRVQGVQLRRTGGIAI